MDWVTTTTILHRLREEDDGTAWRGLVERFRPPVVAFAAKLGLRDADGEEVAQETMVTFLEAWRSNRYDRERGRLSGWLFGIAYKHVLRQRARLGRGERQVREHDDATTFWARLPDEASVEPIWRAEWERAIVAEALDRVRSEVEPATFRAFELSVGGNGSAEEIAATLGVPVKSVYNAKHRVLKRLREVRAELEDLDEVADP